MKSTSVIGILRAVLAGLNAALAGTVAWFVLVYFLHHAFFTRPPSVEAEANESMVLVDAAGVPERVTFRYQPTDRAPSLYVLFDYERLDGDCVALRLSSLPGLPSAFLRVRGGEAVGEQPLADEAGHAARDVAIDFRDGDIRVGQNGVALLTARFTPRKNTVGLASYPAGLSGGAWPPLKAIRELEITSRAGDGHARTRRMIPVRWQNALGCAGALAVAGMLLALDRRMRFFLARAGRRRRGWAVPVLRTYPAWPLAGGAALLMTAIALHGLDAGPSRTWFGGHVRNGRFDVASFAKDPVLRRAGREIYLSPSPHVRRVFVFGGSTTFGYPYGVTGRDWPSRLQSLLNARYAPTGDRFLVANFGIPGAGLDLSFPPCTADFLATAKPDIVIIDCLINEYYSDRPSEMLTQGLGLPGHRTPDRPGARARFAARLAEAIAICRRAGAFVVVLEPRLDRFAVPDDPLAGWRAEQENVARESGATLISLRDVFDEPTYPFAYYDFMHPTRLGYKAVARRVFESLLPRFDDLARR
jgi:hypothetical protein